MKTDRYTFNKNNFLILLCLCFQFAFTTLIYAQTETSFYEFKGRITDSDSNKKLSLVNLRIENTNISTVTNSEGDFLIKLSENQLKNSLVISHLGYNTKRITLNANATKNELKIKLETAFTTLEPVDVNTIIDPELLVRNMLQLKAENYLNTNAEMTAFYRETIKKRRTNASLSEAVLTIYKEPYTTNKNDNIKLIKARKKTDYTKLDTLAFKLQGGPFSSLYTDLIKYPKYIFTGNFESYTFKFEQSTQINNNAVYVVSFKQKEEIAYPLYYGKLYIDKQTRALIRAEYKLNVNNKYLASKIFIKRKPKKVKVYPTEASYRVDYVIKDGKWHYSYSNILLTFKVNWKHKLFNSKYTLQSEMAITNWQLSNLGNKKPKGILRPTIILNDEVSGFSDPEFWGKYNIIEPEKSIESAIKKIKKQLEK